MPQTRVFDVVIAGMPLKLRSSHNEETVNQLVDFVNQQIKEALNLTKSGSLQAAALLSCLNIAEELFELKRQAMSELDRIEDRISKTIADMETSRTPRIGLEQ